MPTSTVRDGSYNTPSSGLLSPPNIDRPARSPKFRGMTTATLVVPFRTRSLASSTVVTITARFLSPWAPATTAFDTALPS